MSKRLQTCDTKKGSDELTINLLTNAPVCESLFKYNADGEMSSINDDENVNRQINMVLNLNMQSLKDSYQMNPIGHSHYSGKTGELFSDLSTLTTALQIADSIIVRIK